MATTTRGTLLGAAGAAAALLLAAPTPVAALRTLAAAGSTGSAAAPEATTPLLAAVGLTAWACAGYLLLVTALLLGSRLPGLSGRLLGAAVRRAAPAALRRSVEVALGLGLAVGTVAATPALALDLDRPAVSLELPGTSAAPDLDWPGSATGTVDAGARLPGPPALGTAWPTPPGAAAPAAAAPAATPRAAAAPDPPAVRTAPITVRPGDSLWSLAAGDLGPRATDRTIAAAWPRWWQSNRDVVGDDPDLLLPGTTLVPPSPDHS